MTDGVVKVGAYVPVTGYLLEAMAAQKPAIDDALDRLLCPWNFPDRNPMPRFEIVPSLSRRLVQWAERRLRDWYEATFLADEEDVR